MTFAASIRVALIPVAALAASCAFAAPAPLSAYGNLPGVEDMAMSANGKGLAIAARIDNERKLVVYDGDEKLRALISLGDVKLRGLHWAGDDFVLVTLSTTQNLPYGYTTDKHEFYYTNIISLSGEPQHNVFSKRPEIIDAVVGDYGTRLIDGKWTGYYGGLELTRKPGRDYELESGRPALFAVDLAKDAVKRLAHAPDQGNDDDYLIDGAGTVAATLSFHGNSGHWNLTNSQGTVIASGIDPTGDTRLISFGHDGSTVIYSIEDDTEGKLHWYEVPLAGGASREFLADVDVKRIYFDKTNDRMLGYLEDSSPPKVVMFDPAQQAIVRKVYKAFKGREISLERWTPDFGKVLVQTSGNGDSGTWYMVDVAQLKAESIGLERPEIRPEQVGPISTFAYKAADGLELNGILTLPPGREAKNLPVIMMPHGGPHSHDEPVFDWWAQAFASRGYAVFQPNFRGSTNRDRAFTRAGYGQWGRKMQTDISDGLAALAAQGVIDPARACIVGASYGGYAALAGVTLQDGLYRCAVAVAPVSDLSDMYWTDLRESGDQKSVRISLRESLGDPKTFPEVSPRKHAVQANAPILMIHGKDDTVVPFKQSQAMADALKDAGKPYELVVMREEDHWLSRTSTRQQMLEESMRFVQQYNPAN